MVEETKTTTEEKKVVVAKKVEKPVSNDFAVIRTGGKQYVVKKGQKLRVEKLEVEDGGKITFDDVLLKSINDKLEIGTPTVGSKVEAVAVSQTKADKIIVFKYKKRKNYRVKQGHRQKLTEIEITNI